MSCQYVQYSNERPSLHDDWKFHRFHQPIKNLSSGTTGSSENHCQLKHTHLKNLNIKTCCRMQIVKYPIMNTTLSHYKMILSRLVFFLGLVFFFSLPPPTCTIIFSPAATICKQHTETAGLQLAIIGRDWLRGLMDTWQAGYVQLTAVGWKVLGVKDRPLS